MATPKLNPESDSRKPLTAARVRELLSYDPETGIFTRRIDCGNARAGNPAGTVDESGYVRISIDGKNYRAHRLVVLIETGEWPPHDMDHIDGVRSNNRRANLRPATKAQNAINRKLRIDNASGFKGAYWRPERGKWRAEIRINGKIHRLGTFATAAEAHAAYCAAASEAYGEFARLE